MPLPRGCKIREIDTGARNCFQFQLDCQNLPWNAPLPYAGMIRACRYRRRNRTVYGVTRLFVEPNLRRKGFATALYERAAYEACRRRGRLASVARQRDSNSYDFWVKQFLKGRADRFPMKPKQTLLSERYDKAYWQQTQDLFVLKNCNEPIDLRGLPTRFRYRK